MAERHISKVARTLMGKLGVTREDAILDSGEDAPMTARELYRNCSTQVSDELKVMRAETLGRIAVQGRGTRLDLGTMEGNTSLAHAWGGPLSFDQQDSGRDILVELATLAVIAEMFDQLRREVEHAAWCAGIG